MSCVIVFVALGSQFLDHCLSEPFLLGQRIKKGLPYGAQGIRAAVSEVIIVFQWV